MHGAICLRVTITHACRNLSSILDQISGVGKKRKAALIGNFGSLGEFLRAPVEQIAAVPGIPQSLAEKITQILASNQWQSFCPVQ